jgi:hypothetical protein
MKLIRSGVGTGVLRLVYWSTNDLFAADSLELSLSSRTCDGVAAAVTLGVCVLVLVGVGRTQTALTDRRCKQTEGGDKGFTRFAAMQTQVTPAHIR